MYKREYDRGEIPDLINRFGAYVYDYFRTRVFGPPFEGPWPKWPAYAFEIIEALRNAETEKLIIDRENAT